MIRRGVVLAAGAGMVVAALVATATTYAIFADFETSTGNRATAASVAIGTGTGGGLRLAYPDPLEVGVPQTGTLTVSYRGTVAAGVALRLEAGAPREDVNPEHPLCRRAGGLPDGTPGATLLVTIGTSDPADYCALLDGAPATVDEDVAPGTDVTVTITLELVQADHRFSAAAVSDALVVQARGGFTDTARGSIEFGLAPIPPPGHARRAGPAVPVEVSAVPAEVVAALDSDAPAVDPAVLPAECVETGAAFRPDQVVMLEAGGRPWVAAVDGGPFLVFGTDGRDVIIASGAGDCVVGGGGDGEIAGGDGADVLLGGKGADLLDGGGGDDRLFGAAGTDDLPAGPGRDHLDAGPDGGACSGGVETTTIGCDPPSEEGTAGPRHRANRRRSRPPAAARSRARRPRTRSREPATPLIRTAFRGRLAVPRPGIEHRAGSLRFRTADSGAFFERVADGHHLGCRFPHLRVGI